jgi:IS5 family transposase
LTEMERVIPWPEVDSRWSSRTIPKGERGRPPVALERMLRVYCRAAVERSLGRRRGRRPHRQSGATHFVGIDLGRERAPDATVDATLIAAPSSTKNASGERDPQMKQSKKGNQWYFGMKAHIGVDADSGLVHTVRGTAGNVNDVIEANTLLHGEETQAWGDAGYQGAGKRPDAKDGVRWNIAMRPGKRKLLDKTKLVEDLTDQIERIKASIRAKVEHPFRVIKRQFGHVKVRYRGLAKNTAQLHTLFALSNLPRRA